MLGDALEFCTPEGCFFYWISANETVLLTFEQDSMGDTARLQINFTPKSQNQKTSAGT